MLLSKAQRRQFLEICLKKASYNPANCRRRLQELSTYYLPNLNLLSPHVICGAWAANSYMAPRNTQDIDLLTTEESYEDLVEELELRDYVVDGPLELAPKDRMSSLYGVRLVKPTAKYPVIDVLTSPDPWIQNAINEAKRDPNGNKVLSIPYLVLMKMDARLRDMSDLVSVLGAADGTALGQAKDLILRYLPNSLDDFANLVLLAKIESGK